MSTAQVPLLRAPVPSRGPPRLGLSIPGSPSNGVPQQVPQQISVGFPMGPPQPRSGRGPPKLSLATPGNPVSGGLRLGPIQQKPTQSYASPVQQINQQYSALSFAMGLRNQVRGSPDTSGVSNGLSIQEGQGKATIDWDNENLDVDDLDDEGWKKASENNRIEELGSLGEGAGGAVTRCRIKGGKTVFAMKVCPYPYWFFYIRNHGSHERTHPDYYYRS